MYKAPPLRLENDLSKREYFARTILSALTETDPPYLAVQLMNMQLSMVTLPTCSVAIEPPYPMADTSFSKVLDLIMTELCI